VRRCLAALVLMSCTAKREPGSHHLLTNGLAGEGAFECMLAESLTTESLARNETLKAGLRGNPGGVEFMRYLYQCALPEEATAQLDLEDGTDPIEFAGAAGLAPEWADGPCEEPCQEWVSACLLARSNYYAVTVAFYFVADHPAVLTEGEDSGPYTVEEGAFFGNYFQNRLYACTGRGHDPLAMTFRVCAQPGNRCGIQVVGTCSTQDGFTGGTNDRYVCEGWSEEGGYSNCHNRATIAGTDTFPENSRTYSRVVTSFLRPTRRTIPEEGVCR
jgi:hypothetical protein